MALVGEAISAAVSVTIILSVLFFNSTGVGIFYE
jgi:hypothetical protein